MLQFKIQGSSGGSSGWFYYHTGNYTRFTKISIKEGVLPPKIKCTTEQWTKDAIGSKWLYLFAGPSFKERRKARSAGKKLLLN